MTIHQNFPALHQALDAMESNQRLAQAKQEELSAQLAAWAGFWSGNAHEQALTWSRRVVDQLEHSLQAAVRYTATARQTVMDMEAREAANAGMWT